MSNISIQIHKTYSIKNAEAIYFDFEMKLDRFTKYLVKITSKIDGKKSVYTTILGKLFNYESESFSNDDIRIAGLYHLNKHKYELGYVNVSDKEICAFFDISIDAYPYIYMSKHEKRVLSLKNRIRDLSEVVSLSKPPLETFYIEDSFSERDFLMTYDHIVLKTCLPDYLETKKGLWMFTFKGVSDSSQEYTLASFLKIDNVIACVYNMLLYYTCNVNGNIHEYKFFLGDFVIKNTKSIRLKCKKLVYIQDSKLLETGLNEKIRELEIKEADLMYKPGGSGYYEAERHFIDTFSRWTL